MEKAWPEQYNPSEEIIPVALIPPVEPPKGVDPVVVEVVGPTSLVLCERPIEVRTYVLALNALLRHRDQMTKSSVLRDEGVVPGMHRTGFRRHIDLIRTELGEAAGFDPLLTEGYGKGMSYQLSCRFQFTEKSTSPDTSTPIAGSILFKPARFEDYSPERKVVFANTVVRESVVSAALKETTAYPAAQSAISEVMAANQETARTRSLPANQRLTAEQCMAQFEIIERGIAAAVQEARTPPIEQAMIDMLTAYHELCYKHIHLVVLARSFARSHTERQDYLQAGNLSLVRAIMRFNVSPEEGSGGAFGSYAYSTIKGELLDFRDRLPDARETTDEPFSIAEHESLVVHEQVVREVERRTVIREIHALLTGQGLTDREKIVLSMRSGIFIPELCGLQVVSKGRTLYTYPDTEAKLLEGFNSPVKHQAFQVATLEQVGSQIGLTAMSIHHAEQSALRKAQVILKARGLDESFIT